MGKFKTLLDDLKTNQKLQPLVPYLINFITQSVIVFK